MSNSLKSIPPRGKAGPALSSRVPHGLATTPTTAGSSPGGWTPSSRGPARRVHSHDSFKSRSLALWHHDEIFSKEDVLVNLSLFPEGFLKAGDLAELVAIRPDTSRRSSEKVGLNGRRDAGTPSQESDSHDESRTPRERGVQRSHRELTDLSGDTDTTPDEDELSRGRGIRYVFVVKDLNSDQRTKQPKLQVSLASSIATTFGFKNKMKVMLSGVDEAQNAASHVELSFRDEYLARSDMWRLVVAELSNKSVYKGQKILFMGTIKAQIKHVYLRGEKVSSAYFNSNTKPIFRSESARYVLFIQMSKEMWDFDTDGSGEIIFNKVISGFLPELFRRWKALKARHLVSIILFTRMVYEKDTRPSFASEKDLGSPPNGSKLHEDQAYPYRDFYRVVVSEMGSGEWKSILHQLKREFKTFRRDVSTQRSSSVQMGGMRNTVSPPPGGEIPEVVVSGEPSAAIHGNVLEAISLASTQFATDYIDRDLVRTGISIVVITPGTGLFQVDYDSLKRTTEALISNGIGIDLVCLSRMPLHSVPLFKYRPPQMLSAPPNVENHLDSEDSTPRQKAPVFGSFSSNRSVANSPSNHSNVASSPKGSHTKPPAKDQWCYAVPHWIDVSYWSGSSDPSLHPFDEQSDDEFSPRYIQEASNRFLPRVKMYELQMMGIMENEMSNISIRYLHENPFFSPLRHQSQLSKQPSSVSTSSPLAPGTSAPKPLDRPAPQLPTSVFVKIERDLPVPKQAREAHKWLDVHDDLAFRSVKDTLSIEKQGKVNSRRRNDVDVREQDASYLSTSLATNGRSSGGLNAPAGTAYFDRKMRERQLSAERPKRARSPGAPWDPPIRPAHLSRQFSSGLRRLNAAPPKAFASTELKTEHAVPEKIVGQPSPGRGQNYITSPKTSSLARTEVPSSSDATSNVNTKSDTLSIKSPTQLPDRRSQPITIKNAKVASLSIFDGVVKERRMSEKADAVQAASLSRQVGPKNDVTSSGPDIPLTLSPTSALAPWLTLLNPSNPRKDNVFIENHFGRWQHVFPRPNRTVSMKWKSLCSPAAVPLTTEYFPTAEQLATEYQQNPYNISQNEEDELNEVPSAREDLMRQLVALRLSQGFQLVVGAAVAEAMGSASLKMVNLFEDKYLAEDGAMVMMSKGNTIHRLQCVTGGEVEVQRYVRKQSAPSSTSTLASPDGTMIYQPIIRTTLAKEYETRVTTLGAAKDDYNWNYVDSFIAGYEESFTEHLRFWRARFVLIPVEQPSSSRRPMHVVNEDNEEEIRLEGIRKLTQMWQRFRCILPDERQYQDPRKRKDTNPLNIHYQTRDPSAVIVAQADGLPLVEGDPLERKTQIFPATEPFHRGNINLSTLAQEVQGEKGITMQDRRWHLQLHYSCFIGFEMTTWLLENFKDVDTREEAVELGNQLMSDGLFQHVAGRHQFRDGNYFYQLGSEYRAARPESRRGWFSTKRSDKSVPSTPIIESTKDSSRLDRSRSSSNTEDGSTDSEATTPTRATRGKKLKVALSKVMRYDVDHRKKSYRPEIINLHYDRLHNPDNCYHIRIDWLNVTAKLIEDAIVTWATTAEKFGLRLVEVPIGEASSIADIHPFRGPYPIKLAKPPPSTQPQNYFDANSFSPQQQSDEYYYHKALLKKFNFVLDIEAASNFPEDVDVLYSWGPPDYRYSQYIHRSGVLLAQITTEGDFLLLANRLYNNRTAASNDKNKYDKSSAAGVAAAAAAAAEQRSDRERRTSGYISPFSSPLVRAAPDVIGGGVSGSSATNFGNVSSYTTPENIKNELEAFCIDEAALERFYGEVLSARSEAASLAPGTPFLESSIPTLGLPPSVTAREATTPSPVMGGSGVLAAVPEGAVSGTDTVSKRDK
ncbi:MAG: hypothetical protein M4579_003569 [Chaenotheca gracillima]|nr:MAG: hypothetical protein M4579_003569 [Chaenotheca gracillima]